MHPFASAGVAAVLTASAAKHAKILVFMRNHPVLPLASSTNPEAQGWVPRLEAEHLLDEESSPERDAYGCVCDQGALSNSASAA